uniref:gap junction beta-2 protein-like n=1 Tax=Myxine glutinosa TaxID=7769 RepID=UPI003590294D
MNLSGLETILHGVSQYSTPLGKIWIVALFLFRILVLGIAAEFVWKDERSDFECNTEQPGCTNMCYNYQFPISHIRLWTMQMLFVSTPTLLVSAHVWHRKKRKVQRITVGQEHLVRGGLFWTYMLSLSSRICFEVGFTWSFYQIYDGFTLLPLVKCSVTPCPHTVDCFVSRPMEKTIFNYFMFTGSVLCTLLATAELVFLSTKHFVNDCCIKKSPSRVYPHILMHKLNSHLKPSAPDVLNPSCRPSHAIEDEKQEPEHTG